MNRIRFRAGGLAGHLYRGDVDPHLPPPPLALVAPGLPYEPTAEYITTLLVRSGFDVVQVQYFGTYDSDGSFSLDSATRSLLEMAHVISRGVLRDAKTGTELKVSSTVECAFAHSFGTFVLARASCRGLAVARLFMYAPFLAFGLRADRYGVVADLTRHVPYMMEAMPLTIRFDDPTSWNAFFTTAAASVAFDRPEDLAASHIRLVVGSRDAGLSLGGLEIAVSELKSRSSAVVELVRIDGAGHSLEDLLGPKEIDAIKEGRA